MREECLAAPDWRSTVSFASYRRVIGGNFLRISASKFILWSCNVGSCLSPAPTAAGGRDLRHSQKHWGQPQSGHASLPQLVLD
jgi:hypothetical protein